MAISQLLFRTGNFIGSVQLDVIIRESATTNSVITKNPVERGADFTDHIIIEPMTFEVEGVVSNISTGLLSNLDINPFKTIENLADSLDNTVSNITGATTRSQIAWEALLQLQATREPFELIQGLKSYPNVAILSLTETQDKDTSNGLIFKAKLQEIIVVGATSPLEAAFADQGISDGMISTVNGGLKQVSID